MGQVRAAMGSTLLPGQTAGNTSHQIIQVSSAPTARAYQNICTINRYIFDLAGSKPKGTGDAFDSNCLKLSMRKS